VLVAVARRKPAAALKAVGRRGAMLAKQRGLLCSLAGGAQDGTGANWGRMGLGLLCCWGQSSVILEARSVLLWRRPVLQ